MVAVLRIEWVELRDHAQLPVFDVLDIAARRASRRRAGWSRRPLLAGERDTEDDGQQTHTDNETRSDHIQASVARLAAV